MFIPKWDKDRPKEVQPENDPNNLANWKQKRKSTPKITGLECVRRDWCGLTRDLSRDFLQKVLIDNDLKGAVELVQRTLKRLEDCDVTYDEVSISKSYKGNYENSPSPDRMLQVALAKRLEKRGNPMQAGDRFSYVICRDRPKDLSVAELYKAVSKTKKTKEIDQTHDQYFLKVQVHSACVVSSEFFLFVSILEFVVCTGEQGAD